MSAAALERIREEASNELADGSGLLGGVNVYHLRMLTESEWNGGAGLSYLEVGQMTLDQIWHRLCDLEILKAKTEGKPSSLSDRSRVKPLEATSQLKPNDQGLIRGRDSEGKPMMAKIRGKSLARQLMEEAEERKKAEAKQKEKQERRERRERRRKRREGRDGT